MASHEKERQELQKRHMPSIPQISLIEYGIPYKGPFTGIKYLTTAWVPKIVLVDNENNIDEYTRITYKLKSTRRFIIGDIEYKGSYGIVESLNCYETSISDNGIVKHNQEFLYRKRSRNRESLLCEACFQIASYQMLKEYECEDIISEVKDIICFSDESVGFTMVPFKNMSFLSDVINTMSEKDIVACIAHISVIIWMLSDELGINHRDLKGNNILIDTSVSQIEPKASPRMYKNTVIEYKGINIDIIAHPGVHFVDFGFACSGSGKDTEISATNYFPATDPCPKKGRDIFQLLTTIYLTIYHRNDNIVKYIESLLELPGKDYPLFLRTHGDNSIDWVYFLLGSSTFVAPKCEPKNVLEFLSEKYPSYIKIEKAMRSLEL
jgi:serine/threonine protein kinase